MAGAEQHPPGLLGGISDSHGIPGMLLTRAFGSCGSRELLQNHSRVRFQRQFALGMIGINFLLTSGAIFPAFFFQPSTWHPPRFAASTGGPRSRCWGEINRIFWALERGLRAHPKQRLLQGLLRDESSAEFPGEEQSQIPSASLLLHSQG